MKLRCPRFSVYHSGRGSEPVIVVGSFTSLVAVSMGRPSLGGTRAILSRAVLAENHVATLPTRAQGATLKPAAPRRAYSARHRAHGRAPRRPRPCVSPPR